MASYPHLHNRLPKSSREPVENFLVIHSQDDSFLPNELLFLIFELTIQPTHLCYVCHEPVQIPVKQYSCDCSIRYCLICFRDHFHLNHKRHTLVECPGCHKQVHTDHHRNYYKVDIQLIADMNNSIECPRKCAWIGPHVSAQKHLSCCPNSYCWTCKACFGAGLQTRAGLMEHLKQNPACQAHYNVCAGCSAFPPNHPDATGTTLTHQRLKEHVVNCAMMIKCRRCWQYITMHNQKHGCRPHICFGCQEQFHDVKEMTDHYASCAAIQKCPHCNLWTYVAADKYEEHLDNECTVMRCDGCRAIFDNLWTLEDHYAVCDQVQKCKYCHEYHALLIPGIGCTCRVCDALFVGTDEEKDAHLLRCQADYDEYLDGGSSDQEW